MVDIFKDNNNQECEVCESYPCMSDCPVELLENDPEQLEPLAAIFADYEPDPDIMNREMNMKIGNHLMLIADAILEAQHKWEQKTYMNRIDEIINSYRFYANFAQTLYDAGCFDNVEDVLDYIKKPRRFDKLYNLWLELGYPKKKDKMFVIFAKKVADFKDLQNK